jgi:hypothetical protein
MCMYLRCLPRKHNGLCVVLHFGPSTRCDTTLLRTVHSWWGQQVAACCRLALPSIAVELSDVPFWTVHKV